MNNKINFKNILPFFICFIGLPIFLYVTDAIPRRSLLKESISIVTILSFFLMLAQFFLARSNRWLSGETSIRRIISIHKVIGYIFLSVLFLHPLFIVVPRFFESGIGSFDAFIKIITTFNSPGIVLGICAWWLALILGVTSLMRKKLPLTYNTWRLFHGVLAIVFTVLASWHAMDLGRHITLLLSYYVVLVTTSGVLPLLITYIYQAPVARGVNT